VPPLEQTPEGVRVSVYLQPRGSRSELLGVFDDRLKIRVAAPPVDGEANEALLRFLAKLARVPRASVSLIAGQRSRRKTASVSGITLEEARRRLLPP